MAPDGDPYTTLGLAPGAPLAEVKRAYRRLVKVHHPDAAGDGATARFLAIQAAYEALVGDDGRGRRRPGVARPAPWSADPDRARTTRESWQRRGPRAGWRPDGQPGAGGSTEAGAGAGTGGGSPGRRRRSAGRSGGAGRQGTADRPPDRATPGSTSYDFAEGEPFDPHWTGASWYGQSSGTYWTINPKEYADPRKHGPEYQARGRRRWPPGATATGTTEPGPIHAEPAEPAESAESTEPEAAASHEASAAAPPGATAFDGRDRQPRDRQPRDRQPRDRQPSDRREAPRPSPTFRASPPGHPPPTSPLSGFASIPWSSGPLGRIALALVGWLPIGLAIGVVVGASTGCDRFSAACTEPLAGGAWLVHLAGVALLALIPTLAVVCAAGSLAALAAAVPAAVVLSAAGGSRQPDLAGTLLGVALAIAWLVGAVFAARRARTVTR